MRPYFNSILILTLKWVDFYEKIDLCSKFEYIISKIGESPPKCGSSFPNRDPLYQRNYWLPTCTHIILFLFLKMHLTREISLGNDFKPKYWVIKFIIIFQANYLDLIHCALSITIFCFTKAISWHPVLLFSSWEKLNWKLFEQNEFNSFSTMNAQ